MKKQPSKLFKLEAELAEARADLRVAVSQCHRAETNTEKARHEAESQARSRETLEQELAACLSECERLRVVSERRRTRLPDTRQSITRKFTLQRVGIGEREGEALRVYVTVGLYDDGKPGEVFIKCDRQGSLTSGAFDAVALVMSIALQHGVPLASLTDKLRGMSFEPNGMTGDADFPIAKSVLDLLARWLQTRFPPEVTP